MDNLDAWYSMINEAKETHGYHFDEGLDHYLVLTLDSFLKDTNIKSNILALLYLENIQHESFKTTQNIRYVGDQCLIISGLFPERAQKKNVSLNYYIELGKSSYLKLATASQHLKLDHELFYRLSTHFVGLMDILHLLRKT